MDYTFSITKAGLTVKQTGLRAYSSATREIFSCGIAAADVEKFSNMSIADITDWADECTGNKFCLFIFDKETKEFFAFNDKYGHNEIFLRQTNSGLQCTSDVAVDSEPPPFNMLAVHEFLSFHSIVPPKTIYQDIETVPTAHFARFDVKTKTLSYKQYWAVHKLFNPKTGDYEQLVKDLRTVFYDEICKEDEGKSAVALSGGIDSGGILGILNECSGSTSSISFGPYGKSSGDLESSRLTAKHFASNNTELYPSAQMLVNLIEVSPKLNQPIGGDQLMATSEIYRVAREQDIKKLYFGYGTQMILGNLGLNKLWHSTRMVEKVFGKRVTKFLLWIYAKTHPVSSNVEYLLLADDWVERFFYAQAALYTRERHIYKAPPEDFVTATTDFLRREMEREELLLSDRFVLMYLSSWTNYGQERHNAMMGKVYGVEPFSPYNTSRVAEVILKTPDSFRKKNHWNKQLWRDALKPYVPEHLYMRKGKSLTVPYTKIFSAGLPIFLPYLKGNKLLTEVIDFDVYEKSFTALPEPGTNLLRLITLAAWYDTRYDKERLSQLKRACEAFDFNSRL